MRVAVIDHDLGGGRMRAGRCWLRLLIVAVAFVTSQGARAEPGQRAAAVHPQTPSQRARDPAPKAPPKRKPGMVGTLMFITPASRTLVVDCPLERGMFRLGVWATDTTRI